ncbi:MAG: hypothetical protein A2V67_13590 [Deltaproteobacteria bacterium RBG_13_61_14]|nr:MAG: hypothetical protein A2V67_13590 [Deltaproteobacteria bacterium RBG_13_61_14]
MVEDKENFKAKAEDVFLESPEASELEDEDRQTLAPLSPMGGLERLTPLQSYLAEVRRYPLLSPDEEHEFALRYHDQADRQAAERLVTANLRLVVKIALEYHRSWMDLLDLVQEGNVGLMQAVKRYDPYRGIRLTTYAAFWIRAYILKFLMDNWRLVKIGTTQAQRKLFFNLKKEKERLESSGFVPGPKLLAQALDVKESEIQEMDQRLSGREESLAAPVTEDGKQSRQDVLRDERPAVDEVLAEEQFRELIQAKLQAFRQTLEDPKNKKEAYLFDKRLLVEKPLTLQQVGKRFNISRERARQIEARLIKKIKAFLQAEIPDFKDSDFVLKK